MKNELMVFEGLDVEVLNLSGKVLFNAKDVANCLDIKDVNSVTRNFSDGQIVRIKNSDMHSMQSRKLNNAGENFLTESGVYKLIFKSRKESAERFQDWVTDEVLPTIRQTGGYIPINEDDDDSSIMAKALIIAQKTIDKKSELISQLQPKAKCYEELMDSKGDIDFKVLVKSIDGLKVGRNTFMSVLRDNKVLMSDNTPYQQYINQGYFKVIQVVNGLYSNPKTLTTKKGLDWVIKKCAEWELI
jgi:prophage antirepressor-like protein